MAIVLCPQCNRRVQLTAESLCPGCRSKISEAGTLVPPTPLDSVSDEPKLPERIEPIEDNSNEKTPASASLSSVVERKVDRAHKMARLSWMMPFIVLGLNALVAMMAPGKYQHMGAVLRMGMMILGLLLGIGLAIAALVKSRCSKTGIVVQAIIGLLLNFGFALILTITFLGIRSLSQQAREAQNEAYLFEPVPGTIESISRNRCGHDA